MARGKQTCKILKEIRRQIAEANGIEFVTSECRYKGDCLGTCPKCEAEVRYLEQQLHARSLAGKAVALAGISAASIAMLMPITSEAQTSTDIKILPTDSILAIRVDSLKVKGQVLEEYTNADGTTGTVEMIGAVVRNMTNGKGTATDIGGKFELDAQVGDSIEVAYVGFKSKTVTVTDVTRPITVTLGTKTVLLGECAVIKRINRNILDLYFDFIGEDKKTISLGDVYIERIFQNADGEEDYEELYPEWFEDEKCARIFWNDESALQDEYGRPIKEVTLRITAEGYDDPVIIKVKYPKRNTNKTIRFRSKKK